MSTADVIRREWCVGEARRPSHNAVEDVNLKCARSLHDRLGSEGHGIETNRAREKDRSEESRRGDVTHRPASADSAVLQEVDKGTEGRAPSIQASRDHPPDEPDRRRLGTSDLNGCIECDVQTRGIRCGSRAQSLRSAGIVPGAALGGPTITFGQSLLRYPYYSSVTVRNPHLGNMIYQAALLRIQKRYSHGLTFLASYTKAKLISDSIRSPIDFGNVEQVTTTTFQNGLYNRSAERSLDPTDVSQRLVLSGVYELPAGTGRFFDARDRILNAVVGGWQVNSVAVMQGGVPVVISGQCFNTAVFSNPPSYTYGNVGRVLPDVRGPGVINIDLSVVKNIALTGKARLQIRAEAFNAANHVNLGFPNGGFVAGANGKNSSGSFGTITSARDPRVIQLGIKLIF